MFWSIKLGELLGVGKQTVLVWEKLKWRNWVSKFEDYFDKNFIHLKDEQKNIKIYYQKICINKWRFYGIQNLFWRTNYKNATKVLRANQLLFNYLQV